jgi:hypothetical protein
VPDDRHRQEASVQGSRFLIRKQPRRAAQSAVSRPAHIEHVRAWPDTRHSVGRTVAALGVPVPRRAATDTTSFADYATEECTCQRRGRAPVEEWAGAISSPTGAESGLRRLGNTLGFCHPHVIIAHTQQAREGFSCCTELGRPADHGCVRGSGRRFRQPSPATPRVVESVVQFVSASAELSRVDHP